MSFISFFSLESAEGINEEITAGDDSLNHLAGQITKPLLFTNSIGMTWLTNVLVQDGKLERIYLMGPAFLDDYSVKRVS